MFKKKCSKCKNKIEKTYDFCPFCGKNFKSKYDNEDFGFLGKNDFIEDEKTFGIGSGFMDKRINKAMKMIEKQMREMPKEFNQNPNQNQTNPRSNMHVQFFVNGKKVIPQKAKLPSNQPIKIKNQISKQKAEKFAKLPRKEPKTTMKRLAGKLVYELAMPGVEDVEDDEDGECDINVNHHTESEHDDIIKLPTTIQPVSEPSIVDASVNLPTPDLKSLNVQALRQIAENKLLITKGEKKTKKELLLLLK